MEIKRQGVIAVPGEYKYGDIVEVKTAEELQEAVKRQPSITLTLGHPPKNSDGSLRLPLASEYIGKVFQRWDSEKQAVMGDFCFYDKKLPEELKARLLRGDPVPVSAGFGFDNLVDSMQEGIVYNHVAILDGDGPSPICPLDKCGVNIRMETADSNQNYRYEEERPLEVKEEPEPVSESVPEAVKAKADPFTPEQKEIIKQMMAEATKPVEKIIEAEEAEPEPVPVAAEEPAPVPENQIPQGGAVVSDIKKRGTWYSFAV